MQTGRIVRFQENSCRKGTQRGKAATKRILTEEGNKENEERPKPRRFWQKNAGRKILAKMSEIDRQQCKDRKERNLQPLFSAKLGHAQLAVARFSHTAAGPRASFSASESRYHHHRRNEPLSPALSPPGGERGFAKARGGCVEIRLAPTVPFAICCGLWQNSAGIRTEQQLK